MINAEARAIYALLDRYRDRIGSADLLTLKRDLEKLVRTFPGVCRECAGTGERDSGGQHPWGAPIYLSCDHGGPNDLDGGLGACIECGGTGVNIGGRNDCGACEGTGDPGPDIDESKPLAAVLEIAESMHEVGAITDDQVIEYRNLTLPRSSEWTDEELARMKATIPGIREKFKQAPVASVEGKLQKGDMRVKDDRIWHCTDPDIDRWVSNSSDSLIVSDTGVALQHVHDQPLPERDEELAASYCKGWADCTTMWRDLEVWYGSMPESNGRTNWTAILHRGDFMQGITIERSEYPDRVRYEADRMRWMIGELPEEPDILAYDADAHSGYTEPDQLAGVKQDALRWRELKMCVADQEVHKGEATPLVHNWTLIARIMDQNMDASIKRRALREQSEDQ